MSTYLAGITDYIPHLQPFKPDLNFYQSALAMKQGQYDAAHKQLSNLYGTLLNSPMLRESNINKRTKFFSDISNEIHKISGLDLSREENVTAASNVFKPFIQDQFILKDMAFTKNAYGEMGKAESFRLCTDEKKCGGKYWEGGVRALTYQMQDFAKASDSDSLKFSNPRFTPAVNVAKNAMSFAKEMGFNTENVSWSKDGRFIVTTKNGATMVPSLTDAFYSVFGSDPATQSYYQTEAYLRRKDYSYGKMSEFGSEEAAEANYLQTMQTELKTIADEQLARAEKVYDVSSTNKQVIEDRIKTKGINPSNPKDQRVVAQYEQTLRDMYISGTNKEQTANTAQKLNPEVLTGMDLTNLRNMVDSSVADIMLRSSLQHAAADYAMLTSETKIEADPYQKAAFEHGLALDRMSKQFGYDIEKMKFNASLEILKKSYEEGTGAATGTRLDSSANSQVVLPATAGSSALNPDLLLSDQESKMVTDHNLARATESLSNDIFSKLNLIVNSKDGTVVGNVTVTPALRKQAKDNISKLFGNEAAVPTVTEEKTLESSGWDKLWGGLTALGTFGMNPLSMMGPLGTLASSMMAVETGGGVKNALSEEVVTRKEGTSGGFLDRSGKLSMTSNPEFLDPQSPKYYNNVYGKVTNYLQTDVNAVDLFANDNEFQKKLQTATMEKINRDAVYKINQNNFEAVNRALLLTPGMLDFSSNNPQYSKDQIAKAITVEGIKPKSQFVAEYVKNYPLNPNAPNTITQVARKFSGIGNFPSMFDPLEPTNLEQVADEASDVYDSYTESFKQLYNRKDQITNIKGYVPLHSGYNPNYGSGAGVIAQPLITRNNDSAYPGDLGAQDFKAAYTNIANVVNDPSIASKAVVMFQDASSADADFYEENRGTIDPNALSALQMIMSELESDVKPTDQKRARWDQVLYPIIGNNDRLVGFGFNLNPEFVTGNSGNEKSPGFTRFATGGNNKITVMLPKEAISAGNDMYQRLNRGIASTVMQAYGKVDISEFNDYGGNMQIQPNNLGGFSISGTLKMFDEMGNLQNHGYNYESDASGGNIDQIYSTYVDYLQNIYQENYQKAKMIEEIMKSDPEQSSKYINDPALIQQALK